MNFLRSLLAEAEAMDLAAVPDPGIEVAKGEKVLGALSDDLKRFYAVYIKYCEQMTEQCVEVKRRDRKAIDSLPLLKADQVLSSTIYQHFLDHRKHEIVRNLFWLFVDEIFPKAKKENSAGRGIRAGWKVVALASVDESPQTMGDLLEELLSSHAPQRSEYN